MGSKGGCAHPKKKIRTLIIWKDDPEPVKTTGLSLVLTKLSTKSRVLCTWGPTLLFPWPLRAPAVP